MDTLKPANIRSDPDLGLEDPLLSVPKAPTDTYNLAYIIFFTLGLGSLLPWNAIISAVDYFSYLYPSTSIDRIFAAVYMISGLVSLLVVVIFFAQKRHASFRINFGLFIFIIGLLIIPFLDLIYVKGQTGLYTGFEVTTVVVSFSGLADSFMQGGLFGVASELPERYMQAVVAGTAASGVLASFLRILAKGMYAQNPDGLRKSANLYFSVGIVVMVICLVFYNISQKLPVIKYYNDLKNKAINEGVRQNKSSLTGSEWRKTLWGIVKSVKSCGFGIIFIYIVTLSIFPGFITEDVHSESLKDWYPVLLIAAYNVFDLVGKCSTAMFIPKDEKIAIGGCIARLLFYPLFWGCKHGPMFLRTEIPVMIVTCLLGLTNGYLISVLMILAPKSVQMQHAEAAGTVITLFLVIGLASGSVLAWFWCI